MSLLSQIVSTSPTQNEGSDQVGDVVPGISSYWAVNPTVGNKEYLQTGFVKTFNNNYSTLFTNFKAATFNDNLYAPHPSWNVARFTDSSGSGSVTYVPNDVNYYFLGGNHHIVSHYSVGYADLYSHNYPAVKYGTSLNNAPTLVNFTQEASGIGDSIIFNGRIIYYHFAGYQDPVTFQIFSSAGTSYSSNYSTSYSGYPTDKQWYFAANSNFCMAMSSRHGDSSPQTGTIFTTTNGTTWSQVTANQNFSGTERFFWSPCGNSFFQTVNTAIYSVTSNATYTLRASGLPGTAGLIGRSHKKAVAHSNTATIMTLGSQSNANANFIVRTANGVTWTVQDLANTPGLVGFFTGQTGAASCHSIAYDNSRFILISATGGYCATSSDDGLSWEFQIPKRSVTANVIAGSNSILFINPTSLANTNGRIYIFSNTVSASGNVWMPHDYTDRTSNTTPQWIGLPTSITYAANSNFSTYLRIK